MNHIREQPKFVDTPWIRQRDMERLDQVARQVEGMFSAGFMEVTQGTGIQIAVMPDTGLWGQITDQNPDDTDPDPPQFFYSFVELMPYDNEYAASVSAQWVEKPGGVQQAYNGRLPAREVQGRTDVPVGTIVRLWLADSGDHYHFRYDGATVGGGGGGNAIFKPGDRVISDCCGVDVGEQAICFDVSYSDLSQLAGSKAYLTLFTVPPGKTATVTGATATFYQNFQGVGAVKNVGGTDLWKEPSVLFTSVLAPDADAVVGTIDPSPLPVNFLVPATYGIPISSSTSGVLLPGENVALECQMIGFDVNQIVALTDYDLFNFDVLQCGLARICVTLTISDLVDVDENAIDVPDMVCDGDSFCETDSLSFITAANHSVTEGTITIGTEWTAIDETSIDLAFDLTDDGTGSGYASSQYATWCGVQFQALGDCLPRCGWVTRLTLTFDWALTLSTPPEDPPIVWIWFRPEIRVEDASAVEPLWNYPSDLDFDGARMNLICCAYMPDDADLDSAYPGVFPTIPDQPENYPDVYTILTSGSKEMEIWDGVNHDVPGTSASWALSSNSLLSAPIRVYFNVKYKGFSEDGSSETGTLSLTNFKLKIHYCVPGNDYNSLSSPGYPET